MILHGKAKYFILNLYDTSTDKYLLNNIDFDDLPLFVKHYFIVKSFDSVGININILNLDFQGWWYFKIKCIHPKTDYEEKNLIRNRQEATSKAIEKTCELYNSKQ